MSRRKLNNHDNLPPIHVPHTTLAQLDATLFTSLMRPHIFHPRLMPARRLALVFGPPHDEKAEAISQLVRELRGMHVILVDVPVMGRSLVDALDPESLHDTRPTVILLKDIHLAAPGPIRQWCGQLANWVQKLPAHFGVICTMDEAPGDANRDLCAQFARDVLLLFDLPDVAAIAARLEWNFAAFIQHCGNVAELAEARLELEADDYMWLASFGVNHIARDIDEYCQRVHYRVLNLARAANPAEPPVINRPLLELALHRRKEECFLATRDVARELWPYHHAIGKHPPVFDVPRPPALPTPPVEEEEKPFAN